MRTIQVNPCIKAEDGVSRCKTPEADFFGVYLSEFDPDGPEGCAGCYEWVGDFDDIDHARHFARALAETHGYILEDNTLEDNPMKNSQIFAGTHDKDGLDDDVCEVYGGNDDDDDVREANARLIASAPEMLQALKAVQLMAVCGQLDPFIGEPWLNAVFAVTAKAEGGAA